jgi:hypothetical protein
LAHPRPVPHPGPVRTASFGINVLSYKKVSFLTYKQQSLVENTVSHTNTQTHGIMYKMITVLIVSYDAFISQNFDTSSWQYDSIRRTWDLGMVTYLCSHIHYNLFIHTAQKHNCDNPSLHKRKNCVSFIMNTGEFLNPNYTNMTNIAQSVNFKCYFN